MRQFQMPSRPEMPAGDGTGAGAGFSDAQQEQFAAMIANAVNGAIRKLEAKIEQRLDPARLAEALAEPISQQIFPTDDEIAQYEQQLAEEEAAYAAEQGLDTQGQPPQGQPPQVDPRVNAELLR